MKKRKSRKNTVTGGYSSHSMRVKNKELIIKAQKPAKAEKQNRERHPGSEKIFSSDTRSGGDSSKGLREKFPINI